MDREEVGKLGEELVKIGAELTDEQLKWLRNAVVLDDMGHPMTKRFGYGRAFSGSGAADLKLIEKENRVRDTMSWLCKEGLLTDQFIGPGTFVYRPTDEGRRVYAELEKES